MERALRIFCCYGAALNHEEHFQPMLWINPWVYSDPNYPGVCARYWRMMAPSIPGYGPDSHAT